MLLADVVIRPIDRAFEDGEIALNRVRMHIASDILSSAVIDGTVPSEFAANFLSGPAFVRHNTGRAVYLSLDNRPQLLSGNGRDVVRTNLATPLDKREHGFLAGTASSKVLALAAVFVLFQSADERFVNFDGLAFAAELCGEMAVSHCFAQTMLHKPGRFVRDPQRAMQLMGAYALLAGRYEVSRLSPLVNFDVAGLEKGADRNREFALAWPAAPQPSAATPDFGYPIKPSTTRAKSTLWPYDCFKPRNRGDLVMEMRLRKNTH
jgi:hypothetical protein